MKDRSKYGEIDAYLNSITNADAKEILRAVMYGFAGQSVSRNKAVSFIGGSKKYLATMQEKHPEICLGRRQDCSHSVTEYDVFGLMQLASIVRL